MDVADKKQEGGRRRAGEMRPPRLGIVAAGGVGAALMVWLASYVTIPAPPRVIVTQSQVSLGVRPSGAHPPELVLAGADGTAPKGLVSERLRLLDPAPLFLPLRVGAGGLSGGREPRLAELTGTVAKMFPALLRFNEAADLRALLRPAAVSESVAVSGIILENKWFLGLSRAGAPDGGVAIDPDEAPPGIPATPARALQVRIFRLNEKSPQATVDWGGAGDMGFALWKPLRFIVLVDASGRWSTPSITSGSGIDEVDEKIRWIVGRDLLPTLRLWPGMYRLEVGP